jgi:Mrp family chromosome partitioning ATPase
MGKMLETLRHAVGRRPADDRRPRPEDEPERVVRPDGGEEEVPFIEVGPHRSLEASPSVLAHRPAPTAAAPAAPDAAPAVAFRPALSEEGRPLRPRFAPEVVAFHQPDHPISAQYRDLLAALAASAGAPPRALLFAPALPDGDAGAVVLNVAVVAVRAGRHVVVVDAARRPPSAAERLGLAQRPGLAEVLSGAAPLDRAVQPTDLAGLSALPAGGGPDLAGGVRYAAETLRSVLRQLRQRLDLVLVRGPCWDGRGDVLALGAACDAVYLILPAREAASMQVDELVQTLPAHGVRLGGYILADEERPAA